MKRTKYIFVTGGVLSGLGKGVSAASLGRTLKARGFKIFVQKLDPYYNTDPGTMSPYQHGEVYVTVDGGETDLDLGHYERFIGETFTKNSNYTQGKILFELLNEERQGKYNGKTVQVVPHVTDKIKEKIIEAGKVSGADFVICELGGTIGDIESQPFFYAVSQFRHKNPRDTFFIHTTYVPFLESSKEFKSKPTQHSISQLQSFGIIPDMILLRSNKNVTDDIIKKVAHKSMIEPQYCIPVANLNNIYKVPLLFEKYNMAKLLLEKLEMKIPKADLKQWIHFINLSDAKKSQEVNLAFIGKYVQLEDAYKSIIEATKISAVYANIDIKINWIDAEELTKENIAMKLNKSDGIIILPGFGKRGFDGKILSADYAYEHDIPTLGICYGFQAMIISQARRQGIVDAHSSEATENGTHVIDIIKGKNVDDSLGGTLRLGSSTIMLENNTIIKNIYGSNIIEERHRHRYEAHPNYLDQIISDNFLISGWDQKTKLAEICEANNKTFYIGLQAHPEFNANPLKESPIFRAFIKSIKTK